MIGFAGLERLLGRRHERLRPANAFDQTDDDLGVLVLDQEIDVVGEIEVEFVAARHRVREIEPAQRRLLQPELERAAGLEHDADRARLKRAHALGRIEQQLLAERERAHAVRTGNAKPVLLRQGAQSLRALLPFGVAAFAELRGVDQRAFQAAGRALGQRVDDGVRRDDGQREIDRLRDRCEIRIDRPAPQLAALRIDQIKLRRETGEFQVLVDFLTPAAAAGIGCPDKRDGFGAQQILNRTKHNHASPNCHCHIAGCCERSGTRRTLLSMQANAPTAKAAIAGQASALSWSDLNARTPANLRCAAIRAFNHAEDHTLLISSVWRRL